MFWPAVAPRTFSGVALFCGLLPLAGCGSATKTVVVYTGTTSSVPQATATHAATTEAAPAEAKESKGTSEAPAAFVKESTFQSPSGNIGCQVAEGNARCDIRQRSWAPPPRPPSCPSEVDFGQGLEDGPSGPGRLVCAGDTTLDPEAPKLAYGTAAESGDFVCVSRTSGITCTNVHTKHGFTIAIQGYRIF